MLQCKAGWPIFLGEAMYSKICLIVTFFFCVSSCGAFNLFTLEDDKALGAQLEAQIASDPDNYPVLSETAYPQAYAYLRGIRDKLLASGAVEHVDDFVWKVYIIEDDETLNAFAAPGGYLYFYTGLIKFLDTEDDFAGVMGHEIAHADKRHSTDALTRQFGIGLLLDIVLGGSSFGIIADVANSLGELAFSRDAESEADTTSVAYLAPTEYACDGAAGFFEKLSAEGGSRPPEFLSTHPDPGSRVETIGNKATELGCDTTPSGNDYQAFKDMLP